MDELRGLWRGKRVDNKEWVEGYLICPEVVGKVAYIGYLAATDNHGIIIATVDPSTLGECTGLRDMNGKLIFEGDIVKYKDNCYEIKYLKKYMRFSPVKPGTVFAVFDYTQSEIVGNIHDNPELLKGEANENT